LGGPEVKQLPGGRQTEDLFRFYQPLQASSGQYASGQDNFLENVHRVVLVFQIINFYKAVWRSGNAVRHNLEVLGWNFGQDTGYTDRFFVVSSVLPGKYLENTSIRPRPLPSKPFPIH
jgi:hypothetical protein